VRATFPEVAFLFILARMGLSRGNISVKTFLLCIFLSWAFQADAQVPYVLEKEFKKCVERGYAEKDFLQFYSVLDSLENKAIDLSDFRNYKIYTSNINNLLNSINFYQKGIAYKLISCLKDKEFCGLLLERMKLEDSRFLKTLNAAAVMHLMPTETTIAFDYLVDSEDFATSPLLAVYLCMDTKSIIKTGYERLNDPRLKAKVFALQTLARFDPDSKVDSIIVAAIKDWDVSIKGYAIVALSVHMKGHYKDILAPYFKEPQLQDVIIETLEKSNIQTDILYAEQLKKKL